MSKTTLEILAERREPTVLLGASGEVTILQRTERKIYRELETFEDIYAYAETTLADVTEEYLRHVNAGALLEHTDEYYEIQKYNRLRATIGQLGVELALRHTQNGVRFSTMTPAGNGLHANERFLSVSPSIYYSLADANDMIGAQYGENKSQKD